LGNEQIGLITVSRNSGTETLDTSFHVIFRQVVRPWSAPIATWPFYVRLNVLFNRKYAVRCYYIVLSAVPCKCTYFLGKAAKSLYNRSRTVQSVRWLRTVHPFPDFPYIRANIYRTRLPSCDPDSSARIEFYKNIGTVTFVNSTRFNE